MRLANIYYQSYQKSYDNCLKSWIFLIDFCLEVLNNYLFLLNIFIIIFKKLYNFSFIPLFNICFWIISFYLALNLIFILFKFQAIDDEKALKCIQYLGKNMIELFTIVKLHISSFIDGQKSCNIDLIL